MLTLGLGGVNTGVWGCWIWSLGMLTLEFGAGDTPGCWVTPVPCTFGDSGVFVTLRSETPICHLEARSPFSSAPKSLRKTIFLQHRVHFSGLESWSVALFAFHAYCLWSLTWVLPDTGDWRHSTVDANRKYSILLFSSEFYFAVSPKDGTCQRKQHHSPVTFNDRQNNDFFLPVLFCGCSPER